QVVQQASTGAPFTVGRLDYPDLLGTSPATRYNSAALAGQGFVTEASNADSTGLAADVSATPFSLGSGYGTGFYRVSFYLIVTQVATISSTLPSLTITWQDPENGINQSQTFAPASPTGNSLTTYLSGVLVLRNNFAAHGVLWSTTGYA